jgi:hypothetical protein
MEIFRPSGNFVVRIMEDVRSYETSLSKEREHLDAFLLSKPVFSILTAGGIMLGLINLVRIALILISPASCL